MIMAISVSQSSKDVGGTERVLTVFLGTRRLPAPVLKISDGRRYKKHFGSSRFILEELGALPTTITMAGRLPLHSLGKEIVNEEINKLQAMRGYGSPVIVQATGLYGVARTDEFAVFENLGEFGIDKFEANRSENTVGRYHILEWNLSLIASKISPRIGYPAGTDQLPVHALSPDRIDTLTPNTAWNTAVADMVSAINSSTPSIAAFRNAIGNSLTAITTRLTQSVFVEEYTDMLVLIDAFGLSITSRANLKAKLEALKTAFNSLL